MTGKKRARIMMYLQDTPGLPLIISVHDSSNVRWYIDESYAIHNDIKSHTGVLMTMGKGVIFWKSCKQKLMGKSSTEEELIGVYDGINQVLWTKFFLSW